MSQIWKSNVYLGTETVLSCGRIVAAAWDPSGNGGISVWHESTPMTQRRVRVVGTGFEVPSKFLHHGILFQDGGFVWHVIEVIQP